MARSRAADLFSHIQAAIPDGQYEPHHVIVRQQPERPVRVASALDVLRAATAVTVGMAHERVCPSPMLGITPSGTARRPDCHEWMVVDETAIHAQLPPINSRKKKSSNTLWQWKNFAPEFESPRAVHH